MRASNSSVCSAVFNNRLIKAYPCIFSYGSSFLDQYKGWRQRKSDHIWDEIDQLNEEYSTKFTRIVMPKERPNINFRKFINININLEKDSHAIGLCKQRHGKLINEQCPAREVDLAHCINFWKRKRALGCLDGSDG